LHKNSQVSQETKETNIEKHNVDGEQQNDIKIEDETAGETHVPRNADESICNQKLPSKDPEVDTLLLATVRSIPETHVCECFGVDYKSFISDVDRVQMSDETHVSILQQILAKYEKWKRDDFLVSLPDYVLVPVQAIQSVFEDKLKKKFLLKVHEIEGDGNCLYRSLSESKLVKGRFLKFKSYKAAEPCQYVREVMYDFA
jgi:hypothetical protein